MTVCFSASRADELHRRRTASSSPSVQRNTKTTDAKKEDKTGLPKAVEKHSGLPKPPRTTMATPNRTTSEENDPAEMLNAWLGELDSLQKVRKENQIVDK